MLFFARGDKNDDLTRPQLQQILFEVMGKLGNPAKVLVIPPDFTRFHSFAGDVTEVLYTYYGDRLTDILPALGTHTPMTEAEIRKMFGTTPLNLFRVHNWRSDVLTLGNVPADFVRDVSEEKVSYSWPAQVNKRLVQGGYDLIVSVGQVVPHEVIGMANYNKNIFVGTGGPEGINKSHFLGAAYGMERIMGRADNPVRKVLNYASDNFARSIPIIYIHTVVDKTLDGLVIRGLYISDDDSGFRKAADLSLEVNFTHLDKPLKKCIVYLDPEEFKSTWLGNKSIYRTRMALADSAELIVLAPGLREFGEDREIDRLIRKYGYRNAPFVLEQTEKTRELQNNLGAAAHLIHGSSEQRFTITYCPGNLTKEEIESVNYCYGSLKDMSEKYDINKLRDGFNTMPDGEEIFFISNPALGLWASKDRFAGDFSNG
jgi:nickel-dependent lactate racemase